MLCTLNLNQNIERVTVYCINLTLIYSECIYCKYEMVPVLLFSPIFASVFEELNFPALCINNKPDVVHPTSVLEWINSTVN